MKNKHIRTKKILIFLAFLSVLFGSNITSSYFQLPAIAQTQNNRKAEADKLRKQGGKQIQAGQYVLGTKTLERAMRIYQEIGDKETYKKILERIGYIYMSRGLQDINKLNSLIEELNGLDSGNYQTENQESKLEDELDWLIIQGFNYQQQKYFEQALSKAKANGGQKEEILALKAFGMFYLYQGNYNDAQTKLKEAERLSAARYKEKDQEAASGDMNEIYKYNHFTDIVKYRIPILLLLGETYLQQNSTNKSLTYFKEASAIATQVDREYKKFLSIPINYSADPSLYLSRAYFSLEKYDLALNYARKAIAKATTKAESLQNIMGSEPMYSFPVPTFGDLGNGHGHVLAGIALEKQGKLEQAEQELKQGIQIFETIRRKSVLQANIKHNLDLFNNQVRASYILQRILLAQNKPEQALAASEWGRSRLLLETATVPKNHSLEEKIDALIDAQYTPESICKDMKRTFSSHDFDCDGEALIQEKKQDYLDEVQKDPRFIDVLTAASPSNTGLSNIQPPNVEQLKQIARSQQKTIVEYSIISETTYFHPQTISSNNYGVNRNVFPGKEEKLVIWVIKPTGEIQTRQIDLKKKNINFKELVSSTRKTIENARTPAIRPKTYNRVELKKQLKQIHKLLIDPIADLLPTDPKAKVVFVPHKQLFLVPFAILIDSNDKYLIEKHTIITAPSIQALKVTREKQQKLPKNNKLAVVVGNPTMPTIPAINNKPPQKLSNLQYAEDEGRKIAQRLNTQFLTGNKATKATVLKQLPNARYIHLATHGLLEDYAGFGIPGAIALAPSGKDKGFLTSSEIQDLDLKAELAVLSACDTGRGDITGDGVVGLSRALIVAGVPSVVVSLWAVPDNRTAELMVEFYRNFQDRKLDKAQALRQAMLEMVKTHRDDPILWGAFTLIGQAG